MEMQGSRQLAATQQQAWDALNNPDVLKECIPGCDSITATGRSHGIWAQTIITATMIGTARNIPGMPQIAPQKAGDRMMPKLDRRSVWPSSIGSSTLPMMNWTMVQLTAMMTVVVRSVVST